MPQPVRVLVLASDPITQAGLAALLGGRPEVQILSAWPVAAAAEAQLSEGVRAVGAGQPAGVGARGAAARPAPAVDPRARLALVPGGAGQPAGALPAQGGQAREAGPAAVAAGPDVALISAATVDEPALRCVREVQQTGVPVVLVVAELDAHDLTAAVDAGVVGLLRRADATPEAVLSAVRGAAGGDGYLPPDLLGPLLRQVRQVSTQVLAPRGLSFSGLTDRELTVLRLVAEGCDTREIGRRLSYSERTVKNILQDVTRRFGLRNRSHAVAYALRHGLL